MKSDRLPASTRERNVVRPTDINQLSSTPVGAQRGHGSRHQSTSPTGIGWWRKESSWEGKARTCGQGHLRARFSRGLPTCFRQTFTLHQPRDTSWCSPVLTHKDNLDITTSPSDPRGTSQFTPTNYPPSTAIGLCCSRIVGDN